MGNIAQQAVTAVKAAGKTGAAAATSNTPTGSYEGVAALQNEFIRVYAAHPVAASVAGAVALLIALAAAGSALPKQTSTPYPSGTYDAKTAAAYYRERPLTVLKRAAFISLAALSMTLTPPAV